MFWSELYEIAKSISAIFGALVFVTLGIYKLVKSLARQTTPPPPNSVSGVVLRFSSRIEDSLRSFLETPRRAPLRIANNPPSQYFVQYQVHEYVFYYNEKFRFQSLGILRALLLLLFGALGPIVLSIFGISWAIDLSSSSTMVIRIPIGILSIVGLVIGVVVYASLRRPGDYYHPHSLKIINGVIFIEGEALLPLKEFGSFLAQHGWLFDTCELLTITNQRGYWFTMRPAIFRYLKGNIPIENVALGMTHFVRQHSKQAAEGS